MKRVILALLLFVILVVLILWAIKRNTRPKEEAQQDEDVVEDEVKDKKRDENVQDKVQHTVHDEEVRDDDPLLVELRNRKVQESITKEINESKRKDTQPLGTVVKKGVATTESIPILPMVDTTSPITSKDHLTNVKDYIHEWILNNKVFENEKNQKLSEKFKLNFYKNDKDALEGKKANFSEFMKLFMKYLTSKACEYLHEASEFIKEEYYIADIQSLLLSKESLDHLLSKDTLEWNGVWIKSLGLRPKSLTLFRNIFLCENFTEITHGWKLKNGYLTEKRAIESFDRDSRVTVPFGGSLISYSVLDYLDYVFYVTLTQE